MGVGGLDEFINELVKVHLKQLDPQATDDIEAKSSTGTAEIVFLCVVLAVICYIIADSVYPYIEPYVFKKKKKKPPQVAARQKK
mmetsp:Transcript_50183/g.129415  ORF Transcript_50183/g.129415 Transcript_50183/m.129415 type:complete len:84 (-) Transcript_50183:280-531(-)